MNTIFFLARCGILLAFVAHAQVKPRDFLIDDSKDYVYLKFDHLGKRQRLNGDQVSQGLWIRLVNNCRIPVIVATFDPGTSDPGVGVYDEIVAKREHGPMPQLGRQPRHSAGQEPIPEGYAPSDTYSTTRVLPGGDVLFSVPANHVGPSWSLHIRFYLGFEGAVYGSGPFSVLTFTLADVPDEFRPSISAGR